MGRLIDLHYYIDLVKESFNIKNKNTLILRDKNIYKKISFVLFLILAVTILSIFTSNEKTIIYKLFDFLINFFSISIGFTITALFFLASDFARFKTNELKVLDNEVKIKICKQLSSTMLISIYSNIFLIFIGLFNNFILYPINFDIDINTLLIINIIYIFIIFSNLFVSLFLLMRSMKFLKKYIDIIVED